MAYQYDIFISVKNDDVFREWVEGTFLPLFETYLKNEIIVACQRPWQKYFYYKKSLQPGDPWPQELTDAIQGSRVAVALCSPEYFYSDWCLTEFYSFLGRNHKVLVPVSIHDGKGFPQDAKNIQAADLHDYVVVGEAFKVTAGYVKFQKEVQALAERVAMLVAGAPPHQMWPIVAKIAPGGDPQIPQQTLGT
jgi:hypothetical protein